MESKLRLVFFLMSAVAALILCSMSLPALAASGAFTIAGSPINVMVSYDSSRNMAVVNDLGKAAAPAPAP